MTRSISPLDLITTVKTYSLIKGIGPEVVHCHSAKGGVYGRLAAWANATKENPIDAFYCPHGGAMHYDKNSLKGRIFFLAERFLERFTQSLIFVSKYEQNAYHDKVGKPICNEAIVYNGLTEAEFIPVPSNPDCADFLYIGMKRDLKGPDVFLDALFEARESSGKNLTAYFVGDGPDEEKYALQIEKLGLNEVMETRNAMPAREAFKLAKIVVVPSRAESMPYLVLEAMAAQKPLVCTNVGGIPEIFMEHASELVEPSNSSSLAKAMLAKLGDPNSDKQAAQMARSLQEKFSLLAMSEAMEAVYRR